MKLDYTSLESAVAQLRKSFDYLHSDLARKDTDLREQFRAATIQAFEFSYELAVRMIRRGPLRRLLWRDSGPYMYIFQ